MTGEHALALEGNLILEVRGTNLAKIDAILKYSGGCGGETGADGPLADHTRPSADRHGLIERSDHYILGSVALELPLTEGDWLGFSQ